MTLGLFAKRYVGAAVPRTTRIPVPRTLLDACLVRAIVLFLAASLIDISIFRYFSPGLLPMGVQPPAGVVSSALLSSALPPLLLQRDAARVSRQESHGSSWKRLLTGVPEVNPPRTS